MSFLDNIKKQEHEKHRMPAWSQAVAELCRFIRRYLRKAEAESPLRVRPDALRVDKVLLERLTILLYGKTVTVTPLSMNDSRAPDAGGCMVMQSTNGVTYNLLWDGGSAAVRDHWKIVRADDHHGQTNKVQLDHVTVSLNGPLQELASLDEHRLDDALEQLFGLANSVEEPSTTKTEHPLNLSRPVTPLFHNSVRSSAHMNLNGRRSPS